MTFKELYVQPVISKTANHFVFCYNDTRSHTTKNQAIRYVATITITVITWPARHMVYMAMSLNVSATWPTDHVASLPHGIRARYNTPGKKK